MISSIFHWLFHTHKWVVINKNKVDYIDTKTQGYLYILQCEKCGNIKKKVIDA